MATVGQQLLQPETGWKRYDNTDLRLTYNPVRSSWLTSSNGSTYNSTYYQINTVDSSVTFKFYGTKFRFISVMGSDESTLLNINIDGNTENFSTNKATTLYQALAYEKVGLSLGIHTVTITHKATGYYWLVDAIDIDDTGDLLGTGIQLTAPEAGWRRYDDTDSRFIFGGSDWVYDTTHYSQAYKGACHITGDHYGVNNTCDGNETITFKFYGSKIRIIGLDSTDSNWSTNIGIKIDDTELTYSHKLNSTGIWQEVLYEQINLPLKVHTVVITNKTKVQMWFDCIDIDDTGYLAHPFLNEVHSLSDIKSIGDCIPCKYTALTSGAVGVFNELGTTIAGEIPIASSATPNGLFYWVYVGKDYLGRKKFLADRDIQNLISWDTLNSNGIISELPMKFNNVYLNPNDKSNNVTLKNNFLTITTVATSLGCSVRANKGVNSGKWYWEITTDSSDTTCMIGIGTVSATLSSFVGYDNNGWSYYMNTGKKYNNISSDYGLSYVGSNTIGIALDCDSGKLEFFLNGVSQGIAFSNLPIGTMLYPMISSAAAVDTMTVNFGGTSFKYSMPIGYNALDGTNVLFKNNNIAIRLLTGGTSATDLDNEWDKVISNSTLGGKITPCDINIWHYGSSRCSLTSSVPPTSGNRVYRGGANGKTWWGDNASSVMDSALGFRPVLLVETLVVDKYLLKKDSKYYSIKPEYYDEITHTFMPLMLAGGSDPNTIDIETFGFDDLKSLIVPITKGSDNFKPIDKLNNCQIKYYIKN